MPFWLCEPCVIIPSVTQLVFVLQLLLHLANELCQKWKYRQLWKKKKEHKRKKKISWWQNEERESSFHRGEKNFARLLFRCFYWRLDCWHFCSRCIWKSSVNWFTNDFYCRKKCVNRRPFCVKEAGTFFRLPASETHVVLVSLCFVLQSFLSSLLTSAATI